MLYDPKWEKPEVKADPFSLGSLIAWLETKPPAERYCYQDNGGCLLHQYFSHAGFNVQWVGGWTFKTTEGARHELSDEFSEIAAGLVRGVAMDFTFGSALSRARYLAVTTGQREDAS
jgi:hypothetical protein